LLELGNSNLTMVDGQELDELLVVCNFLVVNFKVGLELEDVAFLSRFGFKEGLNSGLAFRQLGELLFIVFLPLFSAKLLLHAKLSALDGVVHSLHVEELALQPYIGVLVWVLPLCGALV